ncbi:hypothetical protein [Bacillus sp. WMMC1349]|uniref:hypothetical protein n=1 Tax=Bacillus sp. WMMC1349 TaxID=2736254 RepID=UPI0020A6A264|nr:hypothetical protein [Bacillus sp. WMMC1349]
MYTKIVSKTTNDFTTNDILAIYGTNDILERIETWEVYEYTKGFVAIGNDGGVNVFVMSQEEKEVGIKRPPLYIGREFSMVGV